ncbi:MAG TPA: 3-phosphoshikimate 1-carboxyvinyltransferase [Candidatus Binataceae bacterium]|nr:3-phosphoshikimate 1-carboxyvinyltransferase [Candidatus Binataceae bacterium]
MPPDEIEIVPLERPIAATIDVPGSKSITNRALLLAAMADGRSVIDGALLSDDTRRMAAALVALGFVVDIAEAARRITVDGRGGAIAAARADLDVGGAGTAMRFLAGFVTLGRGRYRLDGNARMRERPAGALIDALAAIGVKISSERGDGCPPIVIDTRAGPCLGGAATIDASLSSQFVSAMLMPAPLWRDGLRLIAPGDTARPFIAMTLALMERWGAVSSVAGDAITVPGGQRYRAMNFTVEPDASSASYFAAAAALAGGTVVIRGLGRDSIQGDARFIDLLKRMGARVTWRIDAVEVIGTGRLAGVDAALNAMPDMVPTLAAIAPFASSPTRIRQVGFIRYHESDRIRVLATELRRLGASVREFDDGLEIEPSHLRPAAIETYDDHRIAMAFAVAGLKLGGVRIKDPGCVAKTYPDFFTDLAHLRHG